MQAEKQSEKQVVSFRIGAEWYGIPVDSVIEIVPFVLLKEVPSVNPEMIGLLRFRDALIPVVDLRLRFGDKTPQYPIDLVIVVAKSESGSVGLLVDDVDDVERVTETDLSANLSATVPFVTNAAKQGDRLLLLVDINTVVANILLNNDADTAHESV